MFQRTRRSEGVWPSNTLPSRLAPPIHRASSFAAFLCLAKFLLMQGCLLALPFIAVSWMAWHCAECLIARSPPTRYRNISARTMILCIGSINGKRICASSISRKSKRFLTFPCRIRSSKDSSEPSEQVYEWLAFAGLSEDERVTYLQNGGEFSIPQRILLTVGSLKRF